MGATSLFCLFLALGLFKIAPLRPGKIDNLACKLDRTFCLVDGRLQRPARIAEQSGVRVERPGRREELAKPRVDGLAWRHQPLEVVGLLQGLVVRRQERLQGLLGCLLGVIGRLVGKDRRALEGSLGDQQIALGSLHPLVGFTACLRLHRASGPPAGWSRGATRRRGSSARTHPST